MQSHPHVPSLLHGDRNTNPIVLPIVIPIQNTMRCLAELPKHTISNCARAFTIGHTVSAPTCITRQVPVSRLDHNIVTNGVSPRFAHTYGVPLTHTKSNAPPAYSFFLPGQQRGQLGDPLGSPSGSDKGSSQLYGLNTLHNTTTQGTLSA